jgi:hypothetical protein
LNLSSVATGPSSTGERQLGTPPIPIPKPPLSDLHYTRLGVGFSFRFWAALFPQANSKMLSKMTTALIAKNRKEGIMHFLNWRNDDISPKWAGSWTSLPL